MSGNKNFIAAAAALVLVVAGLAMGYHMLGPLQNQREISADERRIDDLQAISQLLYSASPKELPPSLAQFDQYNRTHVRDPLTNAPYEYIRDSATAYRLCATFAFRSSEDATHTGPTPAFWDHPKGRHCYHLDSGKYSY